MNQLISKLIDVFYSEKGCLVDLFEKIGLITSTEDQQKELYHYTTHEGLLGILNNNQMWATHIEYLNDSTELRYGLNLAKEELNNRYKQASDDKEKEKLNCLLDEIDSHSFGNISVSCLTEERDLLSQWRAYGGKGSGYSIGFNVTNLIKLAISNGYNLVKVEYDLENQKKIMSKFIAESLIEDFNTNPGRCMPERINDDGIKVTSFLVFATGGDFIKNLYSIAPCLKDPTFKEEREWRLISKIHPKDACFRINKAMLVPYTNLDLGEKNTYLMSITIGPNQHMDLSIEAVKKLMHKYSYNEKGVFDSYLNQNIPILQSKIPYRDW
ncbi:MAG: DUF2971 domain-containing protein [Methylobacter sp.]